MFNGMDRSTPIAKSTALGCRVLAVGSNRTSDTMLCYVATAEKTALTHSQQTND